MIRIQEPITPAGDEPLQDSITSDQVEAQIPKGILRQRTSMQNRENISNDTEGDDAVENQA